MTENRIVSTSRRPLLDLRWPPPITCFVTRVCMGGFIVFSLVWVDSGLQSSPVSSPEFTCSRPQLFQTGICSLRDLRLGGDWPGSGRLRNGARDAWLVYHCLVFSYRRTSLCWVLLVKGSVGAVFPTHESSVRKRSRFQFMYWYSNGK